MRQLPLFPLDLILFPGGTLNLYIFEERYRQMIGRCLEQNEPFGVVLIREGDAVIEGQVGARPAEPYSVGTMARINANVRLEDGRYLLTATGQTRFRIQYLLQHSPYIVASVVELPEERPEPVAPLADELRQLYERCWLGLAAATGTQLKPDETPRDPVEFSYMLADRLQVDLADKQRWLEANLRTRLNLLSARLRMDLQLLPRVPKRDDREDGEGWNGLGSMN